MKISFLTDIVPPADAGRLYNVVIAFGSEGGAALPDRFELVAGVLPTGVTLERDREDNNFDGLPDPDGDYTGNARLRGVPRQRGSYSFTIKAISTGELGSPLAAGAPNPEQPDLAATQAFSINVSEGTIAILTPTEEEGTSDPAVPHFPGTVPFVNPDNPDAFLSFAFQIAGGSNNNHATIYAPREWELSAFDVSVDPANEDTLHTDVDESALPGAPSSLDTFEVNIADGGIFPIQGGQQKVQIGGFQSPRGPVRSDGPDADESISSSDPPFMEVGGVSTLLPIWFQDPNTPKNSRRDFGDSLNLQNGDNTLGTEQSVLFTDYYHPDFKSTTPTPVTEAKYPFSSDQYLNAFFVPYTVGVDLTPLAYRLIVEAIDTKGTISDKTDDVIARKAYVVRVQIPDITVDTIILPGGRAGVPYAAQISLSGGVPPLFTDLEWVDWDSSDLAPTPIPGNPAFGYRNLFGLDVNPKTWQFLGAPRVSAPDLDPSTSLPDGPAVELTVRAWAQVMNPQQAGTSAPPLLVRGPGDRVGLLTLPDGTQKGGVHRTYQLNVELPNPPAISNTALKAGIDGVAYGGDRIKGTDGTPLVAPTVPGFFDADINIQYPSAQATTAYAWESWYDQDDSYPAPQAGVAGLPFNLVLEGSPYVSTNGNITGTPFDRGFHPCLFQGIDFYAGRVGGGPGEGPPHETNFQTTFQKTLTLSISPDKAVYLRGTKTSEGTGGVANGLAADDQMSEPRMVPLLLAVGLFSVDTGKSPERFAGLPTNFDTLPVLMPNGGTDAHNQMSVPQVRGFWPAESNQEKQWYYYPSLGSDQAWKHLQQEFTWLQSPDPQHRRVFMWAEATGVKNHNSSYSWNQRYQILDTTKKRGVFVLNTVKGTVHVPAILDPANNVDDGLLFGGEVVLGCRDISNTSAYNYYEGGMYTKTYYYAVGDSKHDREAHMNGGSNYLLNYNTTYAGAGNGYYMQSLGRTATSVAMSADGKWCATALVGNATGGTDEQKILLFRTDNQPIPAAIMGQSYAVGVVGVAEDGATPLDATNPSGNPGFRAVILKVGGESASGVVITSNQRFLLPDSLTFVENGLLFLNEPQLDRIFGVSLVDGTLSSISVNTASGVNGAGNLPYAVRNDSGQFVPDNDKLCGALPSAAHSVQFAFAGNKAAVGEEGPQRVAFVAGTGVPASQSTSSRTGGYLNVLTDIVTPRSGYVNCGNSNKALFFMILNTKDGGSGGNPDGNGLRLNTGTVLRDLTGNDADVYGDLLTPGRFGEEFDRLVLDDAGKYAAVVRDVSVGGYLSASYYGYYGGFSTAYYYYIIGSPSSYDGWLASQDLLVVSTDGSSMHTSGSRHVLFLGTGQHGNQYSTSSPKGGMPTYAIQAGHLNAAVRRLFGLAFAPDGERVIMNYAGGDYYIPTAGYPFGTNWQPFNPSYTSYGVGDEISVSLKFRKADQSTNPPTDQGPEDFTKTSNITNNLQGLTGISSIGPTAAPIGDTASQQCFWCNFKSADGRFMYYISDQIDSSLSYTSSNRNFMVGFNMTGNDIGADTALSPLRAPFKPFITHPNNVGFEQFDCNAWNYENRFAASPGGIFGGDGIDASGILCVIASDASAGAGSATDLEVYAMDANLGTDLHVLTSAVTTGSSNAINHLYLSCEGNVLAGQTSKTAASSASSRATLNNNSDLFVVLNIHDVVYKGATPEALVVSSGMSHGSTVAFVGDGTGAGPQALIFSSAGSSGSNSQWASRTLKAVPLSANAIPSVLDNTQSVYAVLAGGRLLADVPTTAN